MIKLTEYSHGQGCGCKISPKILDKILVSSIDEIIDPNVLVGNHSRDDAAVYDLGNGEAVISTIYAKVSNSKFKIFLLRKSSKTCS
jgi:selenide,water dikinase